MSRFGLIDVGGGSRGSYGAGVMDRLLEAGIHIPYGIGVSAGSANLASYFAGQKGRNYLFYTEYNLRKEAISLHNLFHDKRMVNVDYIYGTLSNAGMENPLDFRAMMRSDASYWIVAADALTGKPVYFNGREMEQDDYGPLKASSNVPVVNVPYAWKGGLYYDGGISDPIPIEKALQDGCDRVVVILTRPRDYMRKADNDIRLAKLIKHRYPMAAQAFANRAQVYNRELQYCRELEQEGKVKIIAPDSIGHMKTLSKDPEPIKKLYLKGYHDGEEAIAFIQK